jgi:ribosome biogenesis GTPase A
MRKAERQIDERLALVDVVLELRDARAPVSSENAVLGQLTGKRQRVILLAKKDLAEAPVTSTWVRTFRGAGSAIAVSMQDSNLLHKIQVAIDHSGARERIKVKRRLRAIVVGVPNVGKSTLINRLAGAKKAETGPRPGVTRSQQWVALNDELELLDTPGIMMPRIKDAETGLRLGLIAALKEEHIGEPLLATYLLHLVAARSRQQVLAPLKVPTAEVNADYLAAFATRRGYVSLGGEPDLRRASQQLLREFRQGNLGRWTLDLPAT